MRIKAQLVLVVFIVRDYQTEDFADVADIYRASFAEPPWEETWIDEEISAEIETALGSPNSIILVAEETDIIGCCWGYELPFEKFPFLEGKLDLPVLYMDTIAVVRDRRAAGTGSILTKNLLERAQQLGMETAVLRTDQRNGASMGLVTKLGFSLVLDAGKALYDPDYPGRIYLSQTLKGGK